MFVQKFNFVILVAAECLVQWRALKVLVLVSQVLAGLPYYPLLCAEAPPQWLYTIP